eukprot:TRINITY_DN896_c0_g2_i1.p1 TRINITY_DN896_c0_g2~~TRINITY_DN896_c0_g2_i1.p1  ORF type:complete len:560 (-),score=73.54 TRINITY_DN896_c0_g2_i1:297-1976(-)
MVVNFMVYVAISLLGGLFAALFVQYLSPQAAGSGIPEMKSMLSGTPMHHFLSLKTLVAKIGSLVFAYMSGLSVGKEGPFVHVAAMVARNLCHFRPFRPLWANEFLRAQVLAAGCAAGVSATFGTPVGGVLFSIEVTSTYYLVQNYWKGFFCAVCGAVVVHLVGGQSELRLFTTNFKPLPYEPLELIAYSLLGIVCGLVGALFIGVLKKINAVRGQLNVSAVPQVLGFVLITAVVAYPIDFIQVGQKSSVNRLFNDDSVRATWDWDTSSAYLNIIIFVLFKFIFSAVSVGLPISAGIFTPSFALGAGIGRLMGELMHSVWPHWGIIPGGYAVVGAAAFASGVTRTFSTAVIVFELTGQLNHMLPVLIAVLLATYVGNRFNSSVYDVLLSMRQLPYLAALRHDALSQLAADVMCLPEVFLPANCTPAEISALLSRSSDADCSIPIVSNMEQMILMGTVQRKTLVGLLGYLADPRIPLQTSSTVTSGVANSPIFEQTASLDAPIALLTSCVVERAPMQLPSFTPLPRVHLMFVLLALKQVFVVEAGRLVGVITRQELTVSTV